MDTIKGKESIKMMKYFFQSQTGLNFVLPILEIGNVNRLWPNAMQIKHTWKSLQINMLCQMLKLIIKPKILKADYLSSGRYL